MGISNQTKYNMPLPNIYRVPSVYTRPPLPPHSYRACPKTQQRPSFPTASLANTATKPWTPLSLSLWLLPSARTPIPPLCCGVCGSSWDMDSFGRRYRVFHLAVANNASLVWYLCRRFSEFLALHAGLVRGAGGERIPRDRWVLSLVGWGVERGGESGGSRDMGHKRVVPFV